MWLKSETIAATAELENVPCFPVQRNTQQNETIAEAGQPSPPPEGPERKNSGTLVPSFMQIINW